MHCVKQEDEQVLNQDLRIQRHLQKSVTIGKTGQNVIGKQLHSRIIQNTWKDGMGAFVTILSRYQRLVVILWNTH